MFLLACQVGLLFAPILPMEHNRSATISGCGFSPSLHWPRVTDSGAESFVGTLAAGLTPYRFIQPWRLSRARASSSEAMQRRFISSLPYLLYPLLLAGYILAIATGAGAHRDADSNPVAVADGLIRTGHGPLNPDGDSIDRVDVANTNAEAANSAE